MEVKQKIRQTFELTPKQLTDLIKEHLAKKGINVTDVEYTVSKAYVSAPEGYEKDKLTKIVIINEVELNKLL